MRSLREYLQQRIEQESKHDYWLFSMDSTYPPAFLGALLLDAIFRPLSQYMNIIHTTDLDYVAKTDFEAVKYTATEIGIDFPLMEHIREWNKFGNTAANMEDFAKLAFNEKRYEPAQQRGFIRRHKGLHTHLRNIYLILETVHRQINHMPNLLYVLKTLYLFYITDRAFNLLNWHLFHSDEVDPPFISLFYYSSDELADISQKKGIAKTTRDFFSINYCQREVIPAYNQLLLDVSFFLSTDYAIWENSSLLFEDIAQWSFL